MSGAVIWGRSDDGGDIGLVGRMKAVEKCANEADERSVKNADFIKSIKPWVNVAGVLGSALIVSITGLIWMLITGAVQLQVVP